MAVTGVGIGLESTKEKKVYNRMQSQDGNPKIEIKKTGSRNITENL